MKFNFVVLSLLVAFMVARTMATGAMETDETPTTTILALNQTK